MDINCATVNDYLHTHIPLSQAMGVSVVAIDERGITLSAPLLPNINHRSTAFGGSMSAVAILAGWTFVHVQLQRLMMPCRIVIQRNCIEYVSPIEDEFLAHCQMPSEQTWKRFITILTKHNKGRIALDVELSSRGTLAGRFQGEYVALNLEQTGSDE